MAKTRYIQGKDGKFKGSIGEGKSLVPRMLRRVASRLNGTSTTPTTSPLSTTLDRFATVSPKVSPTEYRAFTEKANQASTINFSEKFQAEQALRVKAEIYSSTDTGQVQVLEDALAASKAGQMDRARMLYKAAAIGRDARDKEISNNPDLRSLRQIQLQLPKNDFDRADSAYESFVTACQSPFNIPPAGNQPSKTLPFDPIKSGEAVAHIADIVLSTRYEKDEAGYISVPNKKSVYSPDLIEEAQRLSATRFCVADETDPNYPARTYSNFLNKVMKAQETNKALLEYRLTILIRNGISVSGHNSPENQEKIKNPFSY